MISYRLDIQVKALFSVDVIVERPSKSVIEFMVKAKANFKSKSTANNVDIYIPVPDDSEKPQFKSSVGTI